MLNMFIYLKRLTKKILHDFKYLYNGIGYIIYVIKFLVKKTLTTFMAVYKEQNDRQIELVKLVVA